MEEYHERATVMPTSFSIYSRSGKVSTERAIPVRGISRGVSQRKPTLAIQFADGIASLLDIVMIVLASMLATVGFIRFGEENAIADPEDLIRLTILAGLFYAVIARCCGCSDADARFSRARAIPRVVSAWICTIVFLTLMTELLHARVALEPVWLALWCVLGCVLLGLSRAVAVLLTNALRANGRFDRHSAIIGTPGLSQSLAEYLSQHPWLTVKVTGLYQDRAADDATQSSPGADRDVQALVDEIRRGGIEQVFIALPPHEEERIAAVLEVLKLTPVQVRRPFELIRSQSGRHPLVMLGDLPLVTMVERPLAEFDWALKSIADRVVGLAAILLLLPVFCAIALAIRLESPGPIFFRQQREGYNCRMFEIWKFRTMAHGDGPASDVVQATRCDPRVTRVGAFLRRTSLDEIPQLINVLAGEMSLVGPRPHAVTTRAGSRYFCEIAAAYPARHRVKPGITGWAQVRGWRGQTDTEIKLLKRLEYDLYYIENWSILLDLYILLRTGMTVFFQRSAY